MRIVILMSFLIFSVALRVEAASLSPEASASEMLKNYQTRIKNKETDKANELRSLASSVNAQTAVINKEQLEKLKTTKDAKQIAEIKKFYADKVNKLKEQQGVQTKQINDRMNKELNELRAELKAVQAQQQAERKSRERDALKLKQEKAKRLKAVPSSAELKKMEKATELEEEKKLKAAKAKRALEQAAWQKRYQGKEQVILDLANNPVN
jgi:DNA polymerase III alpha subunit (gram-positive type)